MLMVFPALPILNTQSCVKCKGVSRLNETPEKDPLKRSAIHGLSFLYFF